MGKFLGAGLTAGESQVIADLEPFTIVLDTAGLDLLQFRPPEATQREVTARSRRRTYLYFGQLPPESEGLDRETLTAQEADEQRARERLERTVCD